MDMPRALQLLREQIETIESLKKLPPYGPKYRIWENTTMNILKEIASPKLVQMYEYAGPNEAVMSDAQEYTHYLKTLQEKKELLEGFISEHERFAGTGEAVVGGDRPIGSYQLHPEISKVSSKLLDDGHFAQAVEEAFKRVINEVKAHMIRKGGDTFDGGDSLMNHAFGIENQTPLIKFNALSTREERDEQKGIMFLFKGVVAIRNRKAHDNVFLDSPKRAVEYLGLASLLMRLLDLSQEND